MKEAFDIRSATLIKGNIEPWLIDSFASSEWGKAVREQEKLHLIS